MKASFAIKNDAANQLVQLVFNHDLPVNLHIGQLLEPTSHLREVAIEYDPEDVDTAIWLMKRIGLLENDAEDASDLLCIEE